MGVVECSSCQKTEGELNANNLNNEKNNIKISTQHNIDMKLARENFNEYFKLKLPQIGEYYNGNFNNLIPEKIRNYITENLLDISKYEISDNNIFETKPIKFKNGNIYKGNWNKNGEMQGEGLYILINDNALAEGVWDKGELKGGRIFLPNGDIYEGEIKNSTFNGKGKLICDDGIIYEGDFINGEKNGNIKITYPDGSYYKGDYRYDNLNGIGEFFWKKGFVYNGNFLNGKLEGQGILKNETNGSEYNGLFYNNNFEGKGIFKWNNGNIYDGNYHLSKKDGEGIYKEKNGISYKGNWVNGKPHGVGELNKGGKIYKCSWRNGEPIETPSLKNDDSHNNKISAEDLNDLFFIPEEEDIDINNLDYLIRDYREGDFKPNENFSGIFH